MLLLVLTLAIAGGIVLSMAFLQRVDTITRTAEAIIGGDMQRRIPVRGAADDIDRLAVTLNRMLDRIASLMEALRQVSNDIAHDLRTPLGRLRQRLDEVRRNAGSVVEYETAVDHAVAETDEILDTFAALLRIAQIESGTRKAGFRSVDVSALTAHLCQTYLPVAEDARKTLDIDIAPDIAVDGDRELLVQMIANLIENAIRHTNDDTGIVVRLERHGAGAQIVIEDNGPGIPDGERERVLERFYRLERSRTTAGSGLGLSLVAAIAELHNAKVELADANPGLRVSIVFAEVSLERPAAELMRSAEAGFSSSSPYPRRARPLPGRSAAAT
jgi:signal transduction histidine kinase